MLEKSKKPEKSKNDTKQKVTTNETFLTTKTVQYAQRNMSKLWKPWKMLKIVDRKWKEYYNYAIRWKQMTKLEKTKDKRNNKERKEIWITQEDLILLY